MEIADYHKTMANYRNAKKKFFDNLLANAFALTNLDDKNGETIKNAGWYHPAF